jgi:hypothetical protein
MCEIGDMLEFGDMYANSLELGTCHQNSYQNSGGNAGGER